MEGVAGVVSPDDITPGHSEYERSELGLNAALAAHYGAVPVLATGDDTLAREAESVVPGITTVGVKTAFGNRAAEGLHPDESCSRIESAARTALANLHLAASSQRAVVRHDPIERALAHPTHRRIALDVVPNCTNRLLEGPRLAALPLEVVVAEVITKRSSRAGLEHVPRTDEVKCWISRAQAADIQDPDETAFEYEQISGNQIAVCHHVGRLATR